MSVNLRHIFAKWFSEFAPAKPRYLTALIAYFFGCALGGKIPFSRR